MQKRIAIIPILSGSKSVKHKNIKKLYLHSHDFILCFR